MVDVKPLMEMSKHVHDAITVPYKRRAEEYAKCLVESVEHRIERSIKFHDAFPGPDMEWVLVKEEYRGKKPTHNWVNPQTGKKMWTDEQWKKMQEEI